MPSTIDNLMTSNGDEYYYDEEFLLILRTYLPIIRANYATPVSPTNQQLYKYQGDFFGLMDELALSKQYHYAALILNGLTNSTAFSPSMAVILIPDTTYIDQLHSMYTTTFNT